MPIPHRLLVIAESDGDAAELIETLRGSYSVSHVRVDQEAPCQAQLEAQAWDALICRFPSARPPAALRALRARQAGIDPGA